MRGTAVIPFGMRLAKADFQEGWQLMRSGSMHTLEKKIRRRGWQLIKITDGCLRSGVGETAQEAIASALKLALRRVSEHFNAVEVEHIELTIYPWFYLARVRVYPYLIQQYAVMPISDVSTPKPPTTATRRLPAGSPELFPDFAGAMPILKRMLVEAREQPAA